MMNTQADKPTQTASAQPENVRCVYMTREDNNVGFGSFDSIRWAIETHVGAQDHGEYNFAVLYGNEDSPISIDFYKSEPNWNTPTDYVWKP